MGSRLEKGSQERGPFQGGDSRLSVGWGVEGELEGSGSFTGALLALGSSRSSTGKEKRRKRRKEGRKQGEQRTNGHRNRTLSSG